VKPEDLYGLPLDEFTAARNKLAKEAKDKGIAKLKKPSTAAWALNQAARSQKGDVGRFLHAAERVRQGGGRAALDDLRTAEADVRRAALKHTTDTQLAAVNDLLAAAAADPEVGDVLRAGTLTGDEQAGTTGLGVPIGGHRPPGRRAARAKDAKDAKDKAPPRDEVADAREARDARRREQARQAADKARHEAKEADAHADRLAREAADAEDKAARLRKLADAARADADKAKAKADRLQQEAHG